MGGQRRLVRQHADLLVNQSGSDDDVGRETSQPLIDPPGLAACRRGWSAQLALPGGDNAVRNEIRTTKVAAWRRCPVGDRVRRACRVQKLPATQGTHRRIRRRGWPTCRRSSPASACPPGLRAAQERAAEVADQRPRRQPLRADRDTQAAARLSRRSQFLSGPCVVQHDRTHRGDGGFDVFALTERAQAEPHGPFGIGPDALVHQGGAV